MRWAGLPHKLDKLSSRQYYKLVLFPFYSTPYIHVVLLHWPEAGDFST